MLPRMHPRGLSIVSPINTSPVFPTPISPSGRPRNTAGMQASAPPTEIIPRLFISDLAAAENPAILGHLGITHVVSVMRGSVNLPATPIPISCIQLPVTDNPFAELAEHLPAATHFISMALQDPRTRVLVHCVQGISRSASVICAYLIKEYNYTPAQAIQYVKSRRPYAEPNPGFVTQLGEYASSLRR
ncbi:phosphatases II [Trametopsis cervina]|nr:phosphatases II [Trametopsis cervina]